MQHRRGCWHVCISLGLLLFIYACDLYFLSACRSILSLIWRWEESIPAMENKFSVAYSWNIPLYLSEILVRHNEPLQCFVCLRNISPFQQPKNREWSMQLLSGRLKETFGTNCKNWKSSLAWTSANSSKLWPRGLLRGWPKDEEESKSTCCYAGRAVWDPQKCPMRSETKPAGKSLGDPTMKRRLGKNQCAYCC